MYEKLLTYLGKQSRLSLSVSGFALVGLVGVIDYLTGYELAFSISYLIPIALSTWLLGRPTGIVMSVAGAGSWLIIDLLAGHLYSHPAIPYWNATVRLGFFLIVTYTLTALRASQERQKELIAELQSTLDKVKLLEGILPICSFCKKIRDKNNRWNTMEGYVTSHSEAQFSHTFCPDCAKEHYPGYFREPSEG
jgi:hypothetical protein